MQDVFQNFDLIKFNAAKILQYKVTHILIKFYYRIITFDNRMHMFKHLLKRLRRLIKNEQKMEERFSRQLSRHKCGLVAVLRQEAFSGKKFHFKTIRKNIISLKLGTRNL